IKPFVNTNKFKPLRSANKKDKSTFTIGWVGNYDKRSKNYHTIYKSIKNHFKNDPKVRTKEATKNTRISGKDMPQFNNVIELFLDARVKVGIANPVMEGYACCLPILGTNIGIITNYAPPNNKHLILHSNNPRDFTSKINILK